MPGPGGYAAGSAIATAAEALARAQKRVHTIHASRPDDDGSVTVEGGFYTEIGTNRFVIQCEDGSLKEL
jgi:hypothetical protein